MEIQNPDYKYYKQLAGTWKSADGTCVVTLTETVGINMEYGGAVLDGYYGVLPTGPLMAFNPQGMMGMMGMSGSSGDMGFQRDPNEDTQLKLGDRSLKKGDQILYNIDFAWHDTEDRLHFDLSDVTTGGKTNVILYRESKSSAAAETAGSKEGEVQCECGQFFSGKFCPNCGKQRKDNSTFTCSCGYNGPVSNFCPECGKPRIAATPAAVTQPAVQEISVDNKASEPGAGWTCSRCGAKLQTGETCTECGAEIKKEMLFSISSYKTTNPPQYDSIIVWKFSDTRLILQQNESFRFIPATIIEPAMEIIRENEIDKWEEYKGHISGSIGMGGSLSVSYWDGEKMAGTSTDYMAGAAGAYYDLAALFTAAREG